jgi:hypothetical protein
MATTTKITTKQTTKAVSSKAATAENPKKLSKTGRWMREHPKGFMSEVCFT